MGASLELLEQFPVCRVQVEQEIWANSDGHANIGQELLIFKTNTADSMEFVGCVMNTWGWSD